MNRVNILHDFDLPLYTDETCHRRALLIGKYPRQKHNQRWMDRWPNWLRFEKYNLCVAVAKINKLLKIDSTFGLSSEVQTFYPTLKHRLENMGIQVTNHSHSNEFIYGFKNTRGKGLWDNHVDISRLYQNFDREYVMKGRYLNPEKNSTVVWHIDHIPFNLIHYLKFLERMGFC